MNIVRGFSLDTAACLTGIKSDRLRYWAKKGVVTPSLVYEPGVRHGYLYSFQDLVGLKTLKDLRDRYHLSLQSLWPIGKWLRKQYEQPSSTLRFYVYGDQLAFSDAERDQLISATGFGQALFKEVTVDLFEVSRDMEWAASRLRKRNPEDIGRIARQRLVHQSQPVVAGTRMPVSLVRQYFDEGYSIQEILETYPFLDERDIREALAWDAAQQPAAS